MRNFKYFKKKTQILFVVKLWKAFFYDLSKNSILCFHRLFKKKKKLNLTNKTSFTEPKKTLLHARLFQQKKIVPVSESYFQLS